jgi:hypothetical protein
MASPVVSQPGESRPVAHPAPQPPFLAVSAAEPPQNPAYAPTPHAPESSYPVSVAAPVSEPPARRRASYYLLLSIAALALFAMSMFVTILLLS